MTVGQIENMSQADIILFLDELMVSQFVVVLAKSPSLSPFDEVEGWTRLQIVAFHSEGI